MRGLQIQSKVSLRTALVDEKLDPVICLRCSKNIAGDMTAKHKPKDKIPGSEPTVGQTKLIPAGAACNKGGFNKCAYCVSQHHVCDLVGLSLRLIVSTLAELQSLDS
jgi:hypothetical protein